MPVELDRSLEVEEAERVEADSRVRRLVDRGPPPRVPVRAEEDRGARRDAAVGGLVRGRGAQGRCTREAGRRWPAGGRWWVRWWLVGLLTAGAKRTSHASMSDTCAWYQGSAATCAVMSITTNGHSETVGGMSVIVAPNSFQWAGGSSCVPIWSVGSV